MRTETGRKIFVLKILEEMPMEIKTLHSFDTQYSADTVEWCQTENYKNFFAVGTYQLEEKDADVSANNVRKGRIYLFDYNQTSDELTNCQQIETDAILDQKWVENNHVSRYSSSTLKLLESL